MIQSIFSEQPTQKKTFMLWALLSAILLAFTSLLRTIASETPYNSEFVLSFGYLLVSATMIAILKYNLKDQF